MQINRKLNFAILCTVVGAMLMFAPRCLWAASVRAPVKIGVLAFMGEDVSNDRWAPLTSYLNRVIPKYSFSIVPLNLDNIDSTIFGTEVDFLLTNPASYAEMESLYGVTRLLTVRNRRLGGAYTQFGAVIFTRADRNDIQKIEDLRDKSFMAVHANAFGGWWMAWHELLDHGIDPQSDLARLEFSGFPQDKIVYAVRNGTVDAGTVRTDVLEGMAEKGVIDINDFRVLNPQTTSGFPFAHSTQLYPEWPFALVNQKLTKLAQEVSVALLRMEEDSPEAIASRIAGWTVPLDYHTVHDLMKELRVGTYHTYGKVTIEDLIRAYWYWIVVACAAVTLSAGVAIYVIRLNKQLKRTALNLEREIAQRSLAQQTSVAQARRIRSLYAVASMPGLSFDNEISEVVHAGCLLLGMEIGKVTEVDLPNNRSIVRSVYAPEGFPLKVGATMPLNKTYCIIPSLSKKPFAVDHVGQSKWRKLPCYETSGVETYIAAPIWVNQKFFGTLSYANRVPRGTPFQETDVDLVLLMGRWVGVTLERWTQQQELARARSQAETASRAKSDFLARVSHELRTPLNAIIGYSEMLIEDDAVYTAKERVGDLKKITASGRSLLGLINDILDLSKIEAGKMELVVDTFYAAELMHDVAAIMQPAVAKNSNTLVLNVGGALGQMTTDSGKLRQVLLNIVSNACKFTEHGTITISADRRMEAGREWIVCSIVDTGIGMSSAQVGQLFNDFTQASAETSRKYGGTGLGLAISKKLCNMMGGDIEVMSAPTQGSTFILRVPVECESEVGHVAQKFSVA